MLRFSWRGHTILPAMGNFCRVLNTLQDSDRPSPLSGATEWPTRESAAYLQPKAVAFRDNV
jgi:hypothetical protein